MRLHLHAQLLIFIPFHPVNKALTEFSHSLAGLLRISKVGTAVDGVTQKSCLGFAQPRQAVHLCLLSCYHHNTNLQPRRGRINKHFTTWTTVNVNATDHPILTHLHSPSSSLIMASDKKPRATPNTIPFGLTARENEIAILSLRCRDENGKASVNHSHYSSYPKPHPKGMTTHASHPSK